MEKTPRSRPKVLAIWLCLLLALSATLWFLAKGSLTPIAHTDAELFRDPRDLTAVRMRALATRLQRYRDEHHGWPTDLDSIALSPQDNVSKEWPQDAWGNSIRYELTDSTCLLRSDGPDGRPESPDDLIQACAEGP